MFVVWYWHSYQLEFEVEETLRGAVAFCIGLEDYENGYVEYIEDRSSGKLILDYLETEEYAEIRKTEEAAKNKRSAKPNIGRVWVAPPTGNIKRYNSGWHTSHRALMEDYQDCRRIFGKERVEMEYYNEAV